MNNAMTLTVTCKDEATKAKYLELSKKMDNDDQFMDQIKGCTSENEVYETYKEHGYTDLSFSDFITEFKDVISKIVSFQPDATVELNEDELEDVVGGFNFFKFLTSIVSVIPIVGPIVAGVAKAIKAGVEGKGFGEVVKNLAVGVGLAMVDAVVMLGTAGLGSGVATGIKIGTAAMKAGLNQALDC